MKNMCTPNDLHRITESIESEHKAVIKALSDATNFYKNLPNVDKMVSDSHRKIIRDFNDMLKEQSDAVSRSIHLMQQYQKLSSLSKQKGDNKNDDKKS